MGRMIAEGYLAQPEAGRGNGKGLIVLQEYWGLVPHIEDVADRWAREGYVAVAPDLWNGTQTKDPDEAFRLLMALNIAEAADKLRAAVAALQAHGAHGKVGAVGYCMGGMLAVYAATQSPDDIGAVADYYGIHPNVKPDYAKLKAPVLAVFARRDEFLPESTGPELKRRIEEAGGRCELHMYDARHAFFNDTRPEVYDAAAAADAWEQTKAFFARSL